jgi:hypothetical protein
MATALEERLDAAVFGQVAHGDRLITRGGRAQVLHFPDILTMRRAMSGNALGMARG